MARIFFSYAFFKLLELFLFSKGFYRQLLFFAKKKKILPRTSRNFFFFFSKSVALNLYCESKVYLKNIRANEASAWGMNSLVFSCVSRVTPCYIFSGHDDRWRRFPDLGNSADIFSSGSDHTENAWKTLFFACMQSRSHSCDLRLVLGRSSERSTRTYTRMWFKDFSRYAIDLSKFVFLAWKKCRVSAELQKKQKTAVLGMIKCWISYRSRLGLRFWVLTVYWILYISANGQSVDHMID